jgi:phosphoribosyl 1,2-cyclic phosphate phosphodiesterase
MVYMERMFLGTSAAEGIPAVFCRCDYCRRAMTVGGKNIRSRSSFRIDSCHQIDFSPDYFYQMMKHGVDAHDLEHLLITHTHQDHFDLAEILAKECAVSFCEKPLNIYLSVEAAEWVKQFFAGYTARYDGERRKAVMEKFRFVPLRHYEQYQVGELVITAVKGNHRAHGEGEYAINYLIGLQDHRTLFYASDTGWYSEETWEFLKGKKTDILIMECTFGGRKDRGRYVHQHLDIPNFLLMLDRMSDMGFIDGKTEIYATHISHKHPLLHDEMQRVFDQCGYKVTVAYDGLTI